MTPQQLRRLVDISEKGMKVHRETRRRFVDAYCGKWYGDGKRATRSPLNQIQAMVNAVVPRLVYRDQVKCLVRTKAPELDVQAQSFELALDELFRQIAFIRTLRVAVIDAMFGAGIVKTGIAVSGGYLHDTGQPFADVIDLDDYIIDVQANSRESARFEGNKFYVPIDWLNREEYEYDKESIESLKKYIQQREQGRVENVGKSHDVQEADEVMPRIALCDLWIPGEGKIVTIPAESNAPKVILRSVDWDGPERGPYETLGFYHVPSNVLPVSPCAQLFDLHEMINLQARKVKNESEAHKKIGIYQRGNEEDAEAVRKSNDGDMVGVNNVQNVNELEIGAPPDARFNLIQFLLGRVQEHGYHQSLLSGARAGSDTATQEQMLQENVEARLADMRAQVSQFARHVAGKLAWYLWTDPSVHMRLAMTAAGFPIQLEFGGKRQGRWEDFMIDVDLYSVLSDSPQERYKRRMEFLTNAAIPLAEYGMAQGMVLDVPKILSELAEELDIPNFEEMWTQQAPMEMMGATQPVSYQGDTREHLPAETSGAGVQ